MTKSKLKTRLLKDLPIKTTPITDEDYVVNTNNGTTKLKVKDITKNVENKVEILEDNLSEFSEQLDTKAKQSDFKILENRMNSFTTLPEGSTSGNAELIDGRNGADGVTYENIGGAIRQQIKDTNVILTQTEKALDTGIFNIKNMYDWEDGYINSNGEFKTSKYMKRTTKAKFIPFTTVNVAMDGTNYNLHVIEYNSKGTFVKNTDYINKDNFEITINPNYKYAFCLQYRINNVTIADLSTLTLNYNTNIINEINVNTDKLECIDTKPRLPLAVGVSANNGLGSTVCKYTLNADNSYDLNMISGNNDTYSLYNFSLGNPYSNLSTNKYLVEIENIGMTDIDFSNIQNRFTLSTNRDFAGTYFHLKDLMTNKTLKAGEKKQIILDLNRDDIKNLFTGNSSELYFIFGCYATLQSDRKFKLSFIDFTDNTKKGITVADYLNNFNVNDYLDFKKYVENKLENMHDPLNNFKIVCFGDSLTHGSCGEYLSPDKTRTNYPKVLQELTGIETINSGVGGDKLWDIFARVGADPLVLNNITIPQDTTAVRLGNDLKTISGNKFNSLLTVGMEISNYESGRMNPVYVNGVEGKLYRENDIYYFQRRTSGNSVTINRPTIVITDFMKRYRNKDYIYVFYVGQNGGFTDVTDWIGQIKRAVDYIGCDKYVVIACQTNQSYSSWEGKYKEFAKVFGGKFINLHRYLLDYGLTDAKLSATSGDNLDITNGICPQSLKKPGDTVHFNHFGYTVIGNVIYKRLKELYPNYIK